MGASGRHVEADTVGAFNEQRSSAKIVSFGSDAIQFFGISITAIANVGTNRLAAW